jgi:hypothetical protein
MKSKLLRAAYVAATLIVAHSPTNASPLFQSIPDLSAQPFLPLSSFCSSCNGQGFQVYDTFSLSNSSSVGEITVAVATADFDPWPTSVEIQILSVNAGLPGAVLFSQTFDTSQFVSDVPGYVDNVNSQHLLNTQIVSVAPSGLSLAAGDYYISFFNPVELRLDIYGGGSDGFVQMVGTQINNKPGLSLGFELDSANAIPLPATLPLFATGLVGLGLLGWRRKKAQS